MISVLVLVRNTTQFASKCLQSLIRTFSVLGYEDTVEYVLVDDHSDPERGVAELFLRFRRETRAPVKIIRFRKHEHYAHGLAYGFSAARGSSVLFVSHDMIITPACVRMLQSTAALSEAYGIVRSTSQHMDGSGLAVGPKRASGEIADIEAFSEFIARHFGPSVVEDRVLIGDSMLVSRRTLDKIGVVDTRYFGFLADIDYGLRAQRAGFKLVTARGAWLHHEGSGMTKDAVATGKASFDAINARNQRDVEKAYAVFREKWDRSLPAAYPGLDGIDFDRLRALPPRSDYQSPLPLSPDVCELL